VALSTRLARSSTIKVCTFSGRTRAGCWHACRKPCSCRSSSTFEPQPRFLPQQLEEQLHRRVLLGALDVQQDVAQRVQPPRGRVAHESGRHLHPIAPTDRWELWLLAPDGTERQFTVHTCEMPARRGHEVSLMTTTHRCPRVLALANWTTIDGANHARSELQGLVHVGDVLWLAAGFVGMTAWLGDAGMVLFVPAALVVPAAVARGRWVVGQRLAWRLDREIDMEAWRTAKASLR